MAMWYRLAIRKRLSILSVTNSLSWNWSHLVRSGMLSPEVLYSSQEMQDDVADYNEIKLLSSIHPVSRFAESSRSPSNSRDNHIRPFPMVNPHGPNNLLHYLWMILSFFPSSLIISTNTISALTRSVWASLKFSLLCFYQLQMFSS